MLGSRSEAVLDSVLLEALAHAIVSLGATILEEVSYLTVDNVSLSLLIPSLDEPNDTICL